MQRIGKSYGSWLKFTNEVLHVFVISRGIGTKVGVFYVADLIPTKKISRKLGTC